MAAGLSACAFTWQSVSAETLRFGYAGILCPVVCAPETDGLRGYMPDILEAIGAADGRHVDIVDLPKSRLVKDLKRGHVDFLLVPPSSIRANGLAKTDVPAAYFTIGVLRRRDFPFAFTGVDSLKNVTWGVVSGERWRPAYQRHIDDNTGGSVRLIFGEDAYDRLIAMTARNRVDVAISHFDMLDRKRRMSVHADRLVVERTRVFGEFVPLFLAFDPDRADGRARDLAAFFTAGLNRLEASGRLKEILKSYHISEWGGVRISETRDGN